MRIIYSNFDELYWIDFINKMKSKNQATPVCIIDEEKFLLKSKKSFSDCDFFNSFNCIKTKNNFEAEKIEKSILNKSIFKAHKKIAFNLLDRFSQDTESFSAEEKQKIYENTIIYWYSYLKKTKPDLFFSKLPPHQFYDYIIYLCCKLLKIKTLSFFPTYFHPRIFLNNDINNRSKIFLNNKYKKFSNQDSNEFIKNIKKKISSEYKFASPSFYSKFSFVKNSYFKFLIYYFVKLIYNLLLGSPFKKSIILNKEKNSSLINISLFKFNYLELKAVIKKINLSNYYSKLSEKPNFKKKYIYFASAYQPEFTNSPYGGNFYDQIETLELIRKSIPEDVMIYYKEHPAIFNPHPMQSGHKNRNYDYYKKLSNIKNLKFIDISQDSFELIDNSLVVATISGQTGVEACLRKKPCIVFSNTWYSKLNGVFMIKSQKLLKKKYDEIINFNLFTDENEFFHDFYNKSIHMKEVIDLTEGLNNDKLDLLVDYFNYYNEYNR